MYSVSRLSMRLVSVMNPRNLHLSVSELLSVSIALFMTTTDPKMDFLKVNGGHFENKHLIL